MFFRSFKIVPLFLQYICLGIHIVAYVLFHRNKLWPLFCILIFTFQLEASILFFPNTFGPLFGNLHFLLFQVQASILQDSNSDHNVICSLPYCNHYLVFAFWSSNRGHNLFKQKEPLFETWSKKEINRK